MITHLAKLVCKDDNDSRIYISSFFGGINRGRCIQLSIVNKKSTYVQLTEENVDELLGVLLEWKKDK